ncbi:DUF6233 domain-containing protein [Streptomyces tremellae]|uniref:Uncharacterized protein n=1 Tax=Streptomyces tremellae TaxID=1124239 RepID=A0ABP7EG67_9ACTN
MSESVERVEMLRFLLRVQERDLARTRRWLDEAERAAAAEQRREEQAAARRPPAGDWLLDSRHRPQLLHQGWCWELAAGMQPITRAQALEALTAGGVEPCPACHPDAELGVLG